MPKPITVEMSRVPGGQDDYVEANEVETKVLPKNTLVPGDFPPNRRVVGKAQISRRRPHVDTIAQDLFAAIMAQARILRDKAMEGALTAEESQRLMKLTEATAKLSREMREKDKQERIEDLSDEELLAAMAEASKRLGSGEE